jgi:hypothetical protein
LPSSPLRLTRFQVVLWLAAFLTFPWHSGCARRRSYVLLTQFGLYFFDCLLRWFLRSWHPSSVRGAGGYNCPVMHTPRYPLSGLSFSAIRPASVQCRVRFPNFLLCDVLLLSFALCVLPSGEHRCRENSLVAWIRSASRVSTCERPCGGFDSGNRRAQTLHSYSPRLPRNGAWRSPPRSSSALTLKSLRLTASAGDDKRFNPSVFRTYHL